MNPDIEQIVSFLERHRIRATYGAVGQAAGLPARSIGQHLGDKCPSASWVVSAKTGLPTGYTPAQLHPELLANREVISSGEALTRRMKRERP